MLTFFAIGLLMIVLNYMSLLPSSPTNCTSWAGSAS